MIGPGFGARGQTSTEREGIPSEVTIPLLQTFSGWLEGCLLVFCAYLFVWICAASVMILKPRWGDVWYTPVVRIARFVGNTWPCWLVPMPIAGGWAWWHKLRGSKRTIQNRNWPPKYGPADYGEVGLALDEYEDVDDVPPDPPSPPEPSQIPPINLMDIAGVWHNEGIPPLPAVNGDWKLITFLRAHVGQVRPFSRRGAVRGRLYTRQEWEALEAWCIKHKFHSKGARILTPLGKRWAVGTIGRMVNGDHPPTDPPAGHGAKSTPLPTQPSPIEGVGE